MDMAPIKGHDLVTSMASGLVRVLQLITLSNVDNKVCLRYAHSKSTMQKQAFCSAMSLTWAILIKSFMSQCGEGVSVS